MKKLLDFRSHPERFTRIHASIILGSAAPNQTRGIDVYRREARILDALDAISRDTDRQLTTDTKERALDPTGPGVLVLEQADVELIIKRLELPDFWHGAIVRSLVDTRDWLGALPDAPDGEQP